MSIREQLSKVGLNKSEIEVYLYLLENGVSSPPQIGRGTGIARSNAHNTLKSLLEKNLIKRHKKGKRYVYTPADPTVVLRVLDNRRDALEESLLELKKLYKEQKHKPVIRFYEGKDEIRQIFEDILDTKEKEVLGFASTERLFTLFPEYFQKRFQKELKKREIFLRDILTHKSGEKVAKDTKESARPYYDYKTIDKRYGDLPTDMLVWDDKLAIMTLNEPVFGTVIENKDLADTWRAQFEIMWSSIPKEK